VKHAACHAGDTLRMAAVFADEIVAHIQPHVKCELGATASRADDPA
jgi:hypothetical protein